MIRWIKRVASEKLIQNIAALYGVRLINQFLPLVIIPYLARVLGPTGWGLVAFAQAFATYGIVAIEYGFELTATREVAKAKEQAALSQILAGVLGAQAVLSVVVAIIAAGVQTMLPAFHDQPKLLLASLAFAVFQGFYPIWYFVGKERVPLIAAIDTAVKVVATLVIFAIVREPEDGWLVLVAYAGSAAVSTGIGFAMMMREVRPADGSIRLILRTLKLGFSVFVMRIGILMHTAGNAFLMGLIVAPQHVAFFAAGEKLCRPTAWMMHPINTALLPRIANLLGDSPEKARQLASFAMLLMAGIGLALGLMMALLAPWLILLFFGQQYHAAVPVMQVMSMVIPITVLNGALVSQWLIPHGLDRPMTMCVIIGSVCNILIALIVVPHYFAMGMAWVTVISEAGILAGMFYVAHRAGLRPIAFGLLREGLARMLPSRH